MPSGNKRWLVTIVALSIVAVFYVMRNRGDSAKTGLPIAEVGVPSLSAAAKVGEQLFNAHCGSCHGKNAAGLQGVAPPLVHRLYEPNHHSDVAFQRAAQFGIRAHHWRFGNMPPVAGITTDQVAMVIAYIRVLQRANGIE